MGDFKERLKSRRHRLGMDQDALAERSGFSTSSISAWERGINSPTVENLRRLAEVLAVEDWWLLGADAPGASVHDADTDEPAASKSDQWIRVEMTKLRGLAEAILSQIGSVEQRIDELNTEAAAATGTDSKSGVQALITKPGAAHDHGKRSETFQRTTPNYGAAEKILAAPKEGEHRQMAVWRERAKAKRDSASQKSP